MDIFVKEGDGATSISLKRNRRIASVSKVLVGSFKPDSCKTCNCKYHKFTAVQTAFYEGVTKGIGAIPKNITLEEEAKNDIRNLHFRARPLLDALKAQKIDQWTMDCCNLVEDIYGVMAPMELEFSQKRGVPNLDLVEHLGMSQVELINVLIENALLPDWFWDETEN